MTDWTALHDAVHQWAADASGLPVIWSGEGAPRPELPVVVLTLSGGPARIGRDALGYHTDLQQAAGEEVEVRAHGQRRLTLTAAVLAYRPDPWDGSQTALAYAERLVDALGLPGSRATLQAAGLAVLSVGQVMDLTALEGTSHLERRQLEVTLGLGTIASERTGYIDTVEASGP